MKSLKWVLFIIFSTFKSTLLQSHRSYKNVVEKCPLLPIYCKSQFAVVLMLFR